MNNKKFWNDAAKWGLLIGIIMGSSRMVEYGLSLTGSVPHFALLTIEWFVVGLLYSILLYRAIRGVVMSNYESIGFSFGRTINYALIVSMFTSVVVAAISFVYMDSIVGGYDVYLREFITSITKVMSEVQVESSIMNSYSELFSYIESSELRTPTIFNTLLSTLSTYIMSGAAVGVVSYFLIKREVKKRFGDVQQ